MNFIVYDLEATCWLGRPPGGANEVIEIGAIKVDENGKVVSSFNKFVMPNNNPILSKFCKRLTSISQENVDEADRYVKVVSQFKEWMEVGEKEYLLCSWGDSDIKLLRSDCKINGIDDGWLEHNINIKSQYFSLVDSHNKTGLKATTLREGFEFTGIQHRAIADAENTAKIFSKYIDVWQY